MDNKKRHTSGSRSKSKKSKPNDFSVELKQHKISQALHLHDPSTKVKTENSLNKSKGSRKQSKQNSKKPKLNKGSKVNIQQSKEISRSVSAERKHSLVKMNRTQANLEQEDIERRIQAFKKVLNRINVPASINTRQICDFYGEIEESIEMVSEPLYSLLRHMHELYINPIRSVLDMISPYEDLLRKKQDLSKQVEEQVKMNENIYSKLSEEDLQIIKLKEKIEEQRHIIEQKKKSKLEAMAMVSKLKNEREETSEYKKKLFHNEGVARSMKKQKGKIEDFSIEVQEEEQSSHAHENGKSEIENTQKKQHASLGLKGLKLNLDVMSRGETVGFHDQFYSKIDEFSESWRNQALRQKRF